MLLGAADSLSASALGLEWKRSYTLGSVAADFGKADQQFQRWLTTTLVLIALQVRLPTRLCDVSALAAKIQVEGFGTSNRALRMVRFFYACMGMSDMTIKLLMLGIVATIATGCTTIDVTRTTAPESRPSANAVVLRGIESGAPTLRPLSTSPPSAETASGDVLIRVVDVGQALCVVGTSSSGHAFLIDAGHWQGSACKDAIDELVPADESLALVVLTHNDSDHLGQLAKIIASRGIDTLLWTGRTPARCERECAGTYLKALDAIGAVAEAGTTVINLSSTPLEAGQTFELGDVEITFLAGWGTYPSSQGMSPAEFENAVSIMLRIRAGGGSVIVAGDAIGRPLGRSDDATCAVSEGWAVDNVASLLDADVLVASHHGGNNGSATCFIEAVSPDAVIFSAGSGHGHPHRDSVQRFIDAGVPVEKLFRTDRGSNSQSDLHEGEWPESDALACGDSGNDDDVDIGLSADGVFVSYVSPDRCQ